LRELNREFEENTSKQELSLKNRVSEVNELQNRAATLLKTELQVNPILFREQNNTKKKQSCITNKK